MGIGSSSFEALAIFCIGLKIAISFRIKVSSSWVVLLSSVCFLLFYWQGHPGPCQPQQFQILSHPHRFFLSCCWIILRIIRFYTNKKNEQHTPQNNRISLMFKTTDRHVLLRLLYFIYHLSSSSSSRCQ